MIMDQRFTDLRCKEVINISDGCRLGYVGDLDIRIPEGEITAIIVPGPLKFFGLLGRGEEFYIPWRCIKRIGDDVILVEHTFPHRGDGTPPPKRGKKRW